MPKCTNCGGMTHFHPPSLYRRVVLGLCSVCYRRLAEPATEPRTMYPRMTEADHDRGCTGPFARVVEYEEMMAAYGEDGE